MKLQMSRMTETDDSLWRPLKRAAGSKGTCVSVQKPRHESPRTCFYQVDSGALQIF